MVTAASVRVCGVPHRLGGVAGSLVGRFRRGEDAVVLGASVGVAVAASWRYLRPDVVQGDALVHLYWMRAFQDPRLFGDPLTAQLRESARYPDGYVEVLRVATQFADPVAFGEWLGVVLMAVSGWLVFRIVRVHTRWWPAAWLGSALFLALSDIHRFYGGFPRAFVHPAVLLTVLLSMKHRHLAAAMVAAGAALFYPPAALLAVGVLIVATVRWEGHRPRLDALRARYAIAATVILLAATIGAELLSGTSVDVMTAEQARAYPEFTGRVFESSPWTSLKQNRSGLDLRASGSLLALAALALLMVRPANIRLLRAEVLALPIVALGAYVLAQALLFKLYLPHRYTYPLVAFFAIVVAVTIRPTWMFVWARHRAWLAALAVVSAPFVLAWTALHLFPLGPQQPTEAADFGVTAIIGASVALAAAMALFLIGHRISEASLPAAGAVITGVALVGALVALPGGQPRGTRCPTNPVTRYLATLPKTSVIAGDPEDLNCVPLTARRSVVISRKIAPSYELKHFLENRSRMFAMLRAHYGQSLGAIIWLNRRYGATHLWVRRAAVRHEATTPDGVRWLRGTRPYGDFVRRLLTAGAPVTLHLARRCRDWRRGSNQVYRIRCLASTHNGTHNGTPSRAVQHTAAPAVHQDVTAGRVMSRRVPLRPG